MNKKGFAISTMLYGLIFLTIAIFYMIINVVSDRYVVNNDFVDEVRKGLNVVEINNICQPGSKFGECLYNSRDKIGLWDSGLDMDRAHQNVRYVGTNPNNYISFAGSTHRIIGVFDNEHRIRVMNPQSNGKTSYDKNSKAGNYNDSDLKKVMNSMIGDEKNKGIYYQYKDNIEILTIGYTKGCYSGAGCASGALPRYRAGELSANQFLEAYYNILEYPIDNIIDTLGKFIAQIYPTFPSDILLSTQPEKPSTFSFKNNNGAIQNSWMFLGLNEWVADSYNTNYAYIICGDNGNLISVGYSARHPDPPHRYSKNEEEPLYCQNNINTSAKQTNSRHYRANFELTADTLFCGGLGTEQDPYIIGFETC